MGDGRAARLVEPHPRAVLDLTPAVLITIKCGNTFQLGVFLDSASSSTRTPHGAYVDMDMGHEAYVQRAERKRKVPQRGETERLMARTTMRLLLMVWPWFTSASAALPYLQGIAPPKAGVKGGHRGAFDLRHRTHYRCLSCAIALTTARNARGARAVDAYQVVRCSHQRQPATHIRVNRERLKASQAPPSVIVLADPRTACRRRRHRWRRGRSRQSPGSSFPPRRAPRWPPASRRPRSRPPLRHEGPAKANEVRVGRRPEGPSMPAPPHSRRIHTDQDWE